ncbi:MAG TPA: polyhydroxyalkanoate synthesis regulator DNA-binding domain-containing protein, partial [Silvibacterium sp.]|nr:polyhydroxyalkanoate synthesis regulator DNA-binding domain-containing protein [Silvibacterium sp.]
HKLIIEGYNIRVLDAKTKEDITSKVLTQILLEYEPLKLDMFSNELLIQAIRVNDRLLKDFVDVYFRQAFEAFCHSQKQVDQMLRQAHHLTSALPAAASSAANLLPSWMPFSAFLPSAPAPASEANKDRGSAGVQNEVAALREEVSKLKAQLNLRSSSPRRKQKR